MYPSVLRAISEQSSFVSVMQGARPTYKSDKSEARTNILIISSLACASGSPMKIRF